MLKILAVSIFIYLCVEAQTDSSIYEKNKNLSDKDSCSCVPAKLCYDNDGFKNLRHKCEKENDVCCDKKPKKTKRQAAVRPAGCGYRNPQGIGNPRPGAQQGEANFGEIPWMVAVHKVDVDPGTNIESSSYICGGSLINPKAVLTAAHCVLGRNKGKRFKIRAGEWDTQSTNEIYPYQDREVIQINTPKNYRQSTLYNDITVLILNEALTLGPNIDVVCIPQPQQSITNGDCFVSGWGKNKAGTQATILKIVQQPIVDTSKCNDILRTTKLGPDFELHFNFICAGGVVGQDICEGFGGSPLMCPVPGQQGRYYQAGLVSWGIGCGDNIPGVYTNLAEFRSYIDEQMQYQRLNESFYKF